MNRIGCFFIGLALILTCVYSLGIERNNKVYLRNIRNPKNVKNNKVRVNIPSETNIYFVSGSYSDLVTIPSNYDTKYQIPLDGCSSPTFKIISGVTANVSSTGLVCPKGTKWYWKGNFGTTAYVADADKIVEEFTAGVTVINVTCPDGQHQIKVKVNDYGVVFLENKKKAIISECAYSGLTQYQMFANITRWIGRNTDYCASYYTPNNMLFHGCGDCWASTDLIVEISTRVGINAWGRRGNQDSMAGSGHRNAIAYIDGTYYIGEAGYTGRKPRMTSVYEEPLGFSVSGSTIYQYDGVETSVTIPSKIGTRDVTVLGRDGIIVFIRSNIKSIHFTAGIQRLGKSALYGTHTTELKTITVDANSQYLEAANNVLYTKWKKTLIFASPALTTLVISSNTTQIMDTALRGMKLDKLVIPGSIKTMGVAILEDSTVKELIIEDGVQVIGDTVFQGVTTPKIVLPDSVTTLGPGAFYSAKVNEIVLSKNIKAIPEGCFQSSTVSNVVIPGRVTTIGDKAFAGCSRLTNITLPLTLRSIGKDVFPSSLKKLVFRGTKAIWNTVQMNSSLPAGVSVEFGNEDDAEQPPDEYSEPDAFPGWGIALITIGSVAAVAGVVVAAIFVAKKVGSSSSSSSSSKFSSVEIKATEAPSSKETQPDSAPKSEKKSKHPAPSRPAPTTPPPSASAPPPTPPRNAPAPPSRGKPSYLNH